MAAMTRYNELQSIFDTWASRTVLVLKQMIKAKKIKETDDLLRSLAVKLSQQNGNFSAEFWFKTYGRFVDMGKGRQRKIEMQATNREAWTGKARKPKKWYSRPFHARLHLLSEVMTVKVAETALNSIADDLRQK